MDDEQKFYEHVRMTGSDVCEKTLKSYNSIIHIILNFYLIYNLIK